MVMVKIMGYRKVPCATKREHREDRKGNEPFPLFFPEHNLTINTVVFLVFVLGLCLGLLIQSWLSKREQQQWGSYFKGVSSDIVKQNNDQFLQLAGVVFEKYQQQASSQFDQKTEQISNLLQPVRVSLSQVDQKIQELEQNRLRSFSGLEQQMQFLVNMQKELHQETSQLVRALRQPASRGRWGEIQLRRVIEMAGMIEHCDFCTQETIEGSAGRLRPDVVVRLPGEKRIIIDAKTPLEAYLEAIESDSDEHRLEKLQLHAKQVRHHIMELSKKSYWEQFPHSPEFVVLFLPGEPFFAAALQQDPQLIEIGVEQKVILATPTTLIALLRAAHYGWRQERIAQNAEEIGQAGRELYKRLCDMNDHWHKVGKSLQNSVHAYNQAIGSFERRVMPQIRRFKDLKSTGEEAPIQSPEPIEQIARPIHPAYLEDPHT